MLFFGSCRYESSWGMFGWTRALANCYYQPFITVWCLSRRLERGSCNSHAKEACFWLSGFHPNFRSKSAICSWVSWTNFSLIWLRITLQSAYRPNHSTETALLKIENDILMNMDIQTTCYASYPSGPQRRLWYLWPSNSPKRSIHSIQGSCLGPLLFAIYSSKLFNIVNKHLRHVHAYADDTQLLIWPLNLVIRLTKLLLCHLYNLVSLLCRTGCWWIN